MSDKEISSVTSNEFTRLFTEDEIKVLKSNQTVVRCFLKHIEAQLEKLNRPLSEEEVDVVKLYYREGGKKVLTKLKDCVTNLIEPTLMEK